MSHHENETKENSHEPFADPSKGKLADRIQRIRARRKQMTQQLTVPERIENIHTRMGLTTSTPSKSHARESNH